MSEMNAFSYAKKRLASSSENPSAGPEAKQQKLPDSWNKCLYCGVLEHKIAECRTRIKIEKRENKRRSERSRPAVSSKVSCFIAPNCPSLQKTNRDSNNNVEATPA
jgi:hypothetical protein